MQTTHGDGRGVDERREHTHTVRERVASGSGSVYTVRETKPIRDPWVGPIMEPGRLGTSDGSEG